MCLESKKWDRGVEEGLDPGKTCSCVETESLLLSRGRTEGLRRTSEGDTTTLLRGPSSGDGKPRIQPKVRPVHPVGRSSSGRTLVTRRVTKEMV